MIAMYNTIFGILPGLPAQKGSINCAKAPPNGFARLITAVAATLPRFVNQRSEYLVGAARTNGCARPVRICPNITPPKLPCVPDFVAPYLIQLPRRIRTDAIIMDHLGPL